MKQLILNQNDIYKVENIEYFKFTYNNKNFRDINTNLSKNDKYILEIIAEYCELDYKELSKKNLIKIIEKSNCLVIN